MCSSCCVGDPPEARAVAERMADVCGLLNALHGELVELVVQAKEHGIWGGHGLEVPGAWVAHNVGCNRAHGAAIQLLADRAGELPATIEALTEGRITLDQATVIARHVPAWGDRDMAELAEVATVTQLRRAAAAYPQPDPPSPRQHRRRVTRSSHGDGFTTIRAELPDDEAAVVTAGIDAELDRLHNDRPDGDEPPTQADGLVAMAERSIGTEQAERPHVRPRIVLHLTLPPTAPDADEPPGWHGVWHAGAAVPPSIRRHLGCDADVEALFHLDGRPVGMGRRTRVISDRLRTIVEHRDGGCRVPGCGARHVQIHHLVHWEDGGPTESGNLLSLCPRHHRAHHAGELGIDPGDADTDLIRFRDRWNRPVLAIHKPRPPTADDPPPLGERPPPTYRHPSGEPWDARAWSPRSGPPDAA